MPIKSIRNTLRVFRYFSYMILKRALIILFLLAFKVELAAQENEIKVIREHFDYVEANLEQFEVNSTTTYEATTDGAIVNKYFNEGALVKIRIEYLGETGKLYREFYIDEGQLLFVFDQEFNYNMPYYIDSLKAQELGFKESYDPDKTKKLEHRYYFYNDKMIRWINSDGEHQSQTHTEWKEKEEYYFNELKKLNKS